MKKSFDNKKYLKLQGDKILERVSQFDGKLYIACSLNFNDNLTIGCEREVDHKNNCLIIYDIQTKSYTITRGIDISCMLGIKDEIISNKWTSLIYV